MSKTRVVNLRNEKCDVKICRLPGGEIPAPPNPGCFGNPFVLYYEIQRNEVCDKYRKYFLKRVNEDAAFASAVRSLEGKSLGCFCSPLRCHGDTIVEWLESIYSITPEDCE